MAGGGRIGRAAAILLAGLAALLISGMLAVGSITGDDGTSCGSLASPAKIDEGQSATCTQAWKLRLGFTVTLAVVGVGLLIAGAAIVDSPQASDDE